MTIVNEATHQLVATIPVGAYPWGIAISPDSKLAYVGIMGSDVIDIISLTSFKIVGQIGGLYNVRHVVIDPANSRYLYASLNQPGDVVKIDRISGKILAETHTGEDCRSVAILDRWHGGLRRELSLRHRHRTASERSEGSPGRADRHPSGRGDL